jgi:hypothetical protein
MEKREIAKAKRESMTSAKPKKYVAAIFIQCVLTPAPVNRLTVPEQTAVTA